MSRAPRSALALPLFLVLAAGTPVAHAQLVVPAGAVVSLGGATLDAGCGDVTIAGTLAVGAGHVAHVRHAAVQAGGTLDAGSGTLGLSGNFTQAGTFVPGTAGVTIADGCATATSTFAGAATFYAFTAATAAGRTLVFPATVTQSVTHALSLAGAAGTLVTIRSTAAGSAANLALAAGATQSVSYVDVADNHATGQPIAPGAAATYHSVKGSNSDGWFTVAASGPTGHLNDTGLDRCASDANALATCSAGNTADTNHYPRQDGRFGRDAQATAGVLAKTGGGAAGFDFTPLDAAGNAIALAGSPPVPASTPSCVRDNVTNLVWEVKTDDHGLRDQSWLYTWYDGASGTPSGTTACFAAGRCDTAKYAADVNASGLCGLTTGWRLPTRRELLGLVSYGGADPNIDGNYFPNTATARTYATRDHYAPFPAWIWAVGFATSGNRIEYSDTGLPYAVRLVHDGP